MKSYRAHQYSRVGFDSSVKVNLSLYYGGVHFIAASPLRAPKWVYCSFRNF